MENKNQTNIERLADLYSRVVALRKDLSCFVSYTFTVSEEVLNALSETETKLAGAILATASPEEIDNFIKACADRKNNAVEEKRQWELETLVEQTSKRRTKTTAKKLDAVEEDIAKPAKATRKRAKK